MTLREPNHDLIAKYKADVTLVPGVEPACLKLLDYMGSDQHIVWDARVSYGYTNEVKTTDRDLLRRLIRDRHTSCVETGAVLKFYYFAPIDLTRQLYRHRNGVTTFHSANEFSTRYKEAKDTVHQTPPDKWRLQSTTNKQGSEGFVDPEIGEGLSEDEKNLQAYIRRIYNDRIAKGVAKEQARKDLPLSTYTEGVMRFDLHNLLHFLGLRLDGHAQYEIRQFAGVVKSFAEAVFPETVEAWEDYCFNSVTFSAAELRILQGMLEHVESSIDFCKADLKDHQKEIPNRTERKGFYTKLGKLGLRQLSSKEDLWFPPTPQ